MFILEVALGVVLGLLFFWGLMIFAKGGWRTSLDLFIYFLRSLLREFGRSVKLSLLLMLLWSPVLVGIQWIPEELGKSAYAFLLVIPAAIYIFGVFAFVERCWKKAE